MGTQRYISTSFWDDSWVQTLDPSEKLLYLYLMTNPLTNIAGVYKITNRRICFDTGFNSDTVGHIFTKFEKSGKAYRLDDEYIALPSWPKHQKWETKNGIKDGILSILNKLPENIKNKLIDINYHFDFSLLDQPPTNPPPTPNNGTNSEFNYNLNSEYNINKNNHDLDFYINDWNSFPNLMKCKCMSINLRHPHEVIRPLNIFTHEQIHKAYENYNFLLGDDGYEPFPTFPTGFEGFMSGSGVEVYHEAHNRFKDFKKKIKETSDEQAKRELREIGIITDSEDTNEK